MNQQELRHSTDGDAKAPASRDSPTRTAPRASLAATEPLALRERQPEYQTRDNVQSFALDRDRALRRSEHSASVERLRQAVNIGLWVWPATGLLDWWVTTFAGAGDLRHFLLLRALGF